MKHLYNTDDEIEFLNIAYWGEKIEKIKLELNYSREEIK